MRCEIAGIVKARRDVDQVAQLLGVDAHLVQLLGRGVLVDRLGAGGDSPAQAPGAPRHHVRERSFGVRRLRIGRGSAASRNAATPRISRR